MSGDRVGSREEPGLILALRQHHPNTAITVRCRGSLENLRRTFRGTIVIGIKDDQDAAVGSGLSGSQVDVPFQLMLLEKAMTLYSNRLRHLRHDGGYGGCNAADKDRHCGNLALPFHDRDDG